MAEQAGRGERIYTLSTGGELEPMTEQRFDTEDALQRLIAQHPELLAGEQINPHDPPRWILVRREKGIADSPDAGLARWAVDHLLIDQAAGGLHRSDRKGVAEADAGLRAVLGEIPAASAGMTGLSCAGMTDLFCAGMTEVVSRCSRSKSCSSGASPDRFSSRA